MGRKPLAWVFCNIYRPFVLPFSLKMTPFILSPPLFLIWFLWLSERWCFYRGVSWYMGSHSTLVSDVERRVLSHHCL